MVTLLPPALPLSAVLMTESLMLELLAGSNRPLPVSTPVPVRCSMVTSEGSSNHMPRGPVAVDVLTLMPATSSARLPEVSTNPPFPPCSPPRAEILP